MRYIIDAALLQSQILHRTLVIPSFVYARACEFDMYVSSCLQLWVLLSFSLSYAASFARPIRQWSTKMML